jgi:outer membrane lipoprotein SlyB
VSAHTQVIGNVSNPRGIRKKVEVTSVVLIMGGAAIGAYVGLKIGGPIGAAVGALVGSFVGALAAGLIKSFEVLLRRNGDVKVKYTTRF